MADRISITTPVQGSLSHLSWGSVIAGVVVASAIMFTLGELGMAFGLSLLNPQDSSQDSAIPTIAMVGASVWVISILIATFVGGWAAAHLARQRNQTDSILHGLLVWSLGIVAIITLGASVAGVMVGGAFSLLGSGMNATGAAFGGAAHGAGAALGGVVHEAGAVLTSSAGAGNGNNVPLFNWDEIKFKAQSLLKHTLNRPDQPLPNPAAPQAANQSDTNAATPTQSHQTTANTSSLEENMALVTRLFNNPNGTLSENDRETLVSMLVANSSLSPAEATEQIKQWENIAHHAQEQYLTLKIEAEQKARAMAAATAKFLADAAWVAFVATLLAASAAIVGAHVGGTRDEVVRVHDGRIQPDSVPVN